MTTLEVQIERPKRKTWQSNDITFKLDPGKIFSIVEELYKYFQSEDKKHLRVNPDYLKPANYLRGNGRKLILRTEIIINDLELKGFTLAELVLDDNILADNNLTLEIYGNPNVAIDPDGLYQIGLNYKEREYLPWNFRK